MIGSRGRAATDMQKKQDRKKEIMNSEQIQTPKPSPLWRLARWLLAALIACITLIAFFYAVEDWRGRAAWVRCKRDLEAKGERLDWAAYVPKRVPDDQNFARTPLLEAIAYKNRQDAAVLARFEAVKSFSFATHMGDWTRGKRTDLEACQRSVHEKDGLAGASASPQPASDVLAILNQLEPDWKELRAATQRPYAQFWYDPQWPWNAVIPNMVTLRTLVQLLSVRASAELALNRSDDAFADVVIIQKIGEGLQTQPFLVAAMVRVAILTGPATQPVWEGIVSGKWSDAQLAELQKQYAKFDLLADFQRAMRGGERAVINDLIERDPKEVERLLLNSNSGKTRTAKECLELCAVRLSPSGWRYQNQAYYNRVIQDYALAGYDPERQQVFPRAIDQFIKRFETELHQRVLFGKLAGVAVPNFFKALQTCTRDQTEMNQAVLACALERYRRAEGHYPETLASLAPRFIERVPHDLINGQPLKYQRSQNGSFTLYSVGWNEKDDEGEVSSNREQGDWVWYAAAN